MTSQINFAAITTTYPVAGVDNDSQGFRDNFTAISAGLAVAKSELTALETNAVLVADLATNTAVVNNMLGSTISNGLYKTFYGVYFDGGNVPSTANIDLNNGPVQKFTLSGASPTLTFTNSRLQVVLDILKFIYMVMVVEFDILYYLLVIPVRYVTMVVFLQTQ